MLRVGTRTIHGQATRAKEGQSDQPAGDGDALDPARRRLEEQGRGRQKEQ